MANEQPTQISPLIPAEVATDLPRLQASYLEKTGSRFDHYFCPFMHRDEPTQLCMGHVIPESYANCCRTRVAQRADVDNFYGSVAEADFGTFLEARDRPLPELILDKKMRREMRPRFVVEGKEVEYYVDRGGKAPEHTRVLLESAEDGRSIDMVFKKNPDVMLSSLNKNWGIVVERDCRLTALVTMIKAAYLTLFHMLRYQWALSPGGIDIGYWLLGRFYRENQGQHVPDVRKAMSQFFSPFKHMFRPIESFGGGGSPRGTIEDNFSGMCLGSSGKPFAKIVYVRIADQCHAVLMPGAEDPESAATYCEFLKNDNEKLMVTNTWFNHEKQCWEMQNEPITAHWPKKHVTFDFEEC